MCPAAMQSHGATTSVGYRAACWCASLVCSRLPLALLHVQLSHLVVQEASMALHLKAGQLTCSAMPSIVTCPPRLTWLPSGRFGRLQAARCCWCLERSTWRQRTSTGGLGVSRLGKMAAFRVARAVALQTQLLSARHTVGHKGCLWAESGEWCLVMQHLQASRVCLCL